MISTDSLAGRAGFASEGLIVGNRTNGSMRCLIIAAGRGSRLADKGDSKPLTPILGVPIIERVILTATKGGLDDFYVVTGYKSEKVRGFLDDLSRRRGIKISHIVNGDWAKGNGLSVLKAKGFLDEQFILLMGDHLFDPGILVRLQRRRIPHDEVCLAVDYNMENGLIDHDDVTRVRVDDGKVANIGKGIEKYDGFDTGIFLCSPCLFSALEESMRRYDDASLSGAIKVLARQGRVKAFDIGGAFWIDVDDAPAMDRAEKCLLGQLKKASDGPVARYLNRPLSARISRYLVRTPITPNQVSLCSFVLALVAAVFFGMSGYWPLVVGALLTQLASIVDGCDGEVARLKSLESSFGGWFDAVLDRYADAFLLLGLTWHTFAAAGGALSLFVGFMAIIGSFMNSYTADKYDSLMKPRFEAGRGFRVGRDVRLFLISLGALFNLPLATLLVIAILMNVETVRRVLVCRSHE